VRLFLYFNMMDKVLTAKKFFVKLTIFIIVFISVIAIFTLIKIYTMPGISLRRSQEPILPFPYKSEEVLFKNEVAGIVLSGTLTIPSSDQHKLPAVILISGYGPHDRDAEWAGHKPFLVISDYLTKRGISVLRYDDRGFGKSNGDYHSSTSLDFSTDVESAIRFLKKRAEIDSNRIGLIGHSDGAMIAPIVASKEKRMAFIVMLAGLGTTGKEVMISRQALLEQRMGRSQEEIQQSKEHLEQLIEIVISSQDKVSRVRRLKDFAAQAKDEIPESEIPPGMSKDEFISRRVELLSSPWFKYFFSYDPGPDLQNVACPVLALCGDKDVQVPSRENLNAIGNALARGGNKNIVIKELPGINHMFQECTTGMIDEYIKIEQTFSPMVLKEIAEFIRDNTTKEQVSEQSNK
jgi:pimeloyl-ACP methyl ester carboxylesterase